MAIARFEPIVANELQRLLHLRIVEAEHITYDVQEQWGSYYLAVKGRNGANSSQTFRIRADVTPVTSYSTTVTNTIPVGFVLPPVNNIVESLILYSPTRLDKIYKNADSAAAASLLGKLTSLAAHPKVNGVLINLDDYVAISSAFSIWAPA